MAGSGTISQLIGIRLDQANPAHNPYYSLETKDHVHLDKPTAVFSLALGSSQVRLEIVPLEICPQNETETASPGTDRLYVPESMVTELDGIKTLGPAPGYPRAHVPRGKLTVEWNGALANGSYASPGSYTFVARALSILGNADDSSH
ncbi:hypothetical protein CDD83_1350 [Cordyceps sp. RAO-2017]|nr:hypothetical protein CDD83_1350 [Cordyceps sp. RAO-2017]